MSYNIGRAKYIEGSLLFITKQALVDFMATNPSLAESNCIAPLLERVRDTTGNMPAGGFLVHGVVHRFKSDVDPMPIEKLWWSGQGSGRYYHDFQQFLSHTTGEAKLLVVWEGGDSLTGLIVKDGVVKEAKVSYSLEEK